MKTYNPIVRTFNRLRAALTAATGVDRREVRPDTPLESLLPREYRRELWPFLRESGLPVGPLVPSGRACAAGCLLPAIIAAGAVGSETWPGLLLVVPAWLAVLWVGRPVAVEFPFAARTVGQLVLELTDPIEMRVAGRKWAESEIELKVRMIVADWAGMKLEDVTRKTRWIDLG